MLTASEKSQKLAEGYQHFWSTDPTQRSEWEALVGQLLADDVRLIDEEGNRLADNKDDALRELATLKGNTNMDPGSVQIGTTFDGRTSFGSDREQMTDEDHRRSGWHTCFDKFEWSDSDDDSKIVAIYVCLADTIR